MEYRSVVRILSFLLPHLPARKSGWHFLAQYRGRVGMRRPPADNLLESSGRAWEKKSEAMSVCSGISLTTGLTPSDGMPSRMMDQPQSPFQHHQWPTNDLLCLSEPQRGWNSRPGS